MATIEDFWMSVGQW